MIILFYLPLAGMHGSLVHEKAVLMEEVGNRIRMILKEIHKATSEEKDFEGMGARVAVHSVC